MFNYELVIKDGKGNIVKAYQLEQGESRKGTFRTLSTVQGNKVIPFGKLYVDESQITSKPNGKAKKS
jgi:hypothetical protein